jgi:hypothetical protein
MKTVDWIVEKNLFPEYEEKLVKSIIDSGMNCYFFDDSNYNFDLIKKIKDKYTDKDAVIFYGSLNNGQKIMKQTNLNPGVYLTVENYECYKYYGYLGNELLNKEYMMMGLNDLYRQKEKLIEKYTTKFFIRPSNGYKTFPGQTIDCKDFDKDYFSLIQSYGGLDMDQLILVSPFKKITNESRFVIVDGEVIDGCIYMIDGEKIQERMFDQLALNYVNRIKNLYEPDCAYTLDIAFIEGNKEYKILEINSLCCAGLYQIDIDKVVKSINKMVYKSYNDYWGLNESK